MTKSKYLNFLAYVHETYWTRGRESKEEEKEIRWTLSKVVAKAEEKGKNIFDRQRGGTLHWASREKEESDVVVVKSRIVISIEGWNQDETTAFVILLFFFKRICVTFESTQFMYRGKILLQKNKRAVMSNVSRQEGRKEIKTVDVRRKIKESRRQRRAEHPCTDHEHFRVSVLTKRNRRRKKRLRRHD